jgi:hypothetical protein
MIDPRRVRAEELLGPCSCHEAYTSRGLVDHNCLLCNYAEDLLDYERAAEARAWEKVATEAHSVAMTCAGVKPSVESIMLDFQQYCLAQVRKLREEGRG